MARGFRFIDLFAGIGGTRIAFESAGGKCVFTSESDRFAQQTYEANFGEIPSGDITDIAPASIPDHDVLVAGFPCQPFSIAGVSKKNSLGRPHGFLDRTQGTLFFSIARVLEVHRPPALFLENVRNLVGHDEGRTFAIMQEVLKELGYRVSHRIIDAQAVVPQHRERIYIAGFRNDLDVEFRWPDIRARETKLRDVLEKGPVDPRYTLSDRLWHYLQGYAAKHRAAGNGFGFGLADPDGVSRTLSARYFKDGSEILIPQDNANPRRLTPRECARLMGFPSDFKIPVSDTQAYRQFGNSVVVPLVKQLAAAVAQCLTQRTEEQQLQPQPV